jgi:hypothetical protein
MAHSADVLGVSTTRNDARRVRRTPDATFDRAVASGAAVDVADSVASQLVAIIDSVASARGTAPPS